MNYNEFINPVCVPMGEGTGKGMVVSCFHSSVVATTTVSTDASTLREIVVPAKALAQDGDVIDFHFCGQWDRTQLSFLGLESPTGWSVVLAYGGVPDEPNWAMDVRLTRNSSNTAILETVLMHAHVSQGPVPQITTVAMDHSVAFTLKVVAQVISASYPVTMRTSRGLHMPIP